MQTSTTRRQVRRVLIITLILNLTVAFGKIVVGMISGALAITADGFHSLIDGTSNIVALVANYIAGQPPDDDHPYGHRRFETLAALMIGAFLLLVAWEIGTGAMDRFRGGEKPDLTPLTFAVLIGTLAINISVSTYQIRQGKRLKSELLLADAANTRADVYVTLSVLVSMAVVALLGWAWVDIAAALMVVVLIGRAGLEILRKTGSVLVDTAPYPPEQLIKLVETLPCSPKVVRARSRGPVDAATIDLDVQVPPEMTAEQTEAITAAIWAQLEQNLDGVAEVEVHFSPDDNRQKDYALVARAVADRLGLFTHEVSMIDTPEENVLEMHVEVPSDQSLHEAHSLVSQLETDLQQQMPDLDEVVTHIEPAYTIGAHDRGFRDTQGQEMKVWLLALLREHFPHIDWHHLRIYERETGITVTMHAAFSEDVTVESAHTSVEQAETLLRSHIPQLARVTIHAEPN